MDIELHHLMEVKQTTVFFLDLGPLALTLELAAISTLILLLVAIPLGWWLSVTKSRWKAIVASLVSMPLVLPPTVLGFYLLLALSPSSGFGAWLKEWFDLQLVFSFEGLVLASIIYSMPFMVNPIYSGLSNLPNNLTEASYVLGHSKWTTLRKVLLPNIKPALLTGIVLTFAHTIGEFGVVLMIGGSIPDQTKVASIAIYEEVEAMNYVGAHVYAIVLFALAFGILLLVHSINNGYFKRFWK